MKLIDLVLDNDERATPNHCDESTGASALSLFAEVAATGVVYHLLERGANPEKNGAPLVAAVASRDIDVVQVLLEYPYEGECKLGIETRSKRHDDKTALELAVENKDPQIISLLRHANANTGDTFHRACEDNDLDTVADLCTTPLSRFAQSCKAHSALLKYGEYGSEGMENSWVFNGVAARMVFSLFPEYRPMYMQQPVIRMMRSCSAISAVDLLKERPDGKSLIALAIENKNPEIIKLLKATARATGVAKEMKKQAREPLKELERNAIEELERNATTTPRPPELMLAPSVCEFNFGTRRKSPPSPKDVQDIKAVFASISDSADVSSQQMEESM